LRAGDALFAVDPRFAVLERLVLFAREEPLALFARELVERRPACDALFFPAADRDLLRVVELRPAEDLVVADLRPDVARVDFRVVAIVVLHEEDELVNEHWYGKIRARRFGIFSHSH
jgi:hypothetical protein